MEGKMKGIVRGVLQSFTVVALLCMLAGVAAAQSASSSAGETLFKSKCAMCHGPDGAGKTMMGEKLKIPDLRSEDVQKQTDAQLNQVITDGKAKMPPYKGKLTPEQIDQLVSEIRDLAKKK
jgi:cytochrome c6